MRVCSAVKGSGASPSRQASISPSSTQSRGSACAAASISGKAPVQALLAARPQRDFAAAPDQLQADAVPFPFQQPVARSRRARPARLSSGEARKNGIGLRRDRPAEFVVRQQACAGMRRSASSRRSCAARCARCRCRRSRPAPAAPALRHADAQRAGQQLVEQQALARTAARATQPTTTARRVVGVRVGAPAAGALRSSRAAAASSARPCGRIVEQQRQRFGEVADVVVAFVDQPVGQAALLARSSRAARAVARCALAPPSLPPASRHSAHAASAAARRGSSRPAPRPCRAVAVLRSSARVQCRRSARISPRRRNSVRERAGVDAAARAARAPARRCGRAWRGRGARRSRATVRSRTGQSAWSETTKPRS